jgi:hypothetical protein
VRQHLLEYRRRPRAEQNLLEKVPSERDGDALETLAHDLTQMNGARARRPQRDARPVHLHRRLPARL